MDQIAEQNVYLYSRKRIELTGITDVCEFTENCVEMTLSEGYVGIDGGSGNVRRRNAPDGTLCE